MNDKCQLVANTAIGREPWVWYLHRQARVVQAKINSMPGYWLSRVRGVVRRFDRLLKPASPSPARPAVTPIVTEDQEFVPGTLVRVRSRGEIEKTLDFRRRCHGCPFAEPMLQYCGREFRVAKQVRHFFDEAQRRLVKCRNIVLLEGVFCDGSGYAESRGCDRTCFFFWHVKWLERVAGRQERDL